MTTQTFKLATWNVNSIRIRLGLLQKLIEAENPDIICLQEVKAKREDFPFAEIEAMGYPHIALYSMPGYNGVAILSRTHLNAVDQKDWVGKSDARHVIAQIYDDVEINNIYVPAGGDIPDPTINLSFAHKLAFMDDIAEYWEQHKADYAQRKMIICGDFNVAPLENDVWNHKQMLKIISHTPVEIERLNRLQKSLDFIDVVRHFYPEPQKLYSWWSYRNPNWQTNNKGRRLDHIWVSPNLADRIVGAKTCPFLRLEERPSDHVPVIVEIRK